MKHIIPSTQPALIGLALALLLSVGSAKAEIVTIAFESGVGSYDPENPEDWIEHGARYSGWWLNDVGTPNATDQAGHAHLRGENDGVYPLVGDIQHSWRDSLQGTIVSFDMGYTFDVISIDVRILSRDTPADDPYNMQRLPWSFDLDDTQLMLTSNTVDPVAPDFATFESQFTAVPIDDGTVYDNGDGTFDPNIPATEEFQTIAITGFEDLTTFKIAHSAGLVWIDNIVLDVDMTPVPEPNLLPMLATGVLMLSAAGGYRKRSLLTSDI